MLLCMEVECLLWQRPPKWRRLPASAGPTAPRLEAEITLPMAPKIQVGCKPSLFRTGRPSQAPWPRSRMFLCLAPLLLLLLFLFLFLVLVLKLRLALVQFPPPPPPPLPLLQRTVQSIRPIPIRPSR